MTQKMMDRTLKQLAAAHDGDFTSDGGEWFNHLINRTAQRLRVPEDYVRQKAEEAAREMKLRSERLDAEVEQHATYRINTKSIWTGFHDMGSGGSKKEEWGKIYIEAEEEEATLIFQNRFGHNPHRVSCTCCGPDYSIYSGEQILELTRPYRIGVFTSEKPEIPLWEYEASPSVLFIRAEEIKDEERKGSLRTQGYIWVD